MPLAAADVVTAIDAMTGVQAPHVKQRRRIPYAFSIRTLLDELTQPVSAGTNKKGCDGRWGRRRVRRGMSTTRSHKEQKMPTLDDTDRTARTKHAQIRPRAMPSQHD